MKKAFTLAEILVTLAIIGVVAVLTIPSVIHKIQNHELYTRFIENYNIFSNLYFQLKSEGMIDVADQSSIGVEEDLLKRLKYTLKCEADDSACHGNNENGVLYKALGINSIGRIIYNYTPIYSLPNGADFTMRAIKLSQNHPDENHYQITVDTNGIDRGPNVIGRDYFEFDFYPYQSAMGIGHYNVYTVESRNDYTRNKGKLVYDDSLIKIFCDTHGTQSNYVYGLSCAIRLLKEGKMDY